MLRRTLALCALLAACNDTPPAGSAGDTATGGSTTAGSTSGQVPTTSNGASASSGGVSASQATGDATTSTSGPTTSASASGSSGTSATTTATSGETSTGDSTGAVGSSTGTTGQPGCVDATDCPDPSICHEPVCLAGECAEKLLAAGTPCDGGTCDPKGACVECQMQSDCPPGQTCAGGQCVAPSCVDGKQNGSETDLDCGGPDCAKCQDGQTCGAPSDCTSNLCQDGVCAPAPTCDDNQKNGAETDVDCGGGVCPKCQDGDACAAPSDCMSNLCQAGVCKPAPTCDDGVKNGAETDVDCGGGVCPKCQDGDACAAPSDCMSNLCQAGVCKPMPTCNDGVKNGAETDIDCGGGVCPKCQDGKTCNVAADCTSDTCSADKCVPPGPSCANQAADPATGQRCPIFMPCTQNAECGVFQDCQQWFCNPSKKCELNALVGCWTNKGGNCNAGVVITQQDDPPVDKRFLPPDNVDFREVASIAFTIKNNTADDLYLDKLPVTLDVMGGGSKFDVSSAKIFQNSGGTEHGIGDIIVCLTADPFSFPANGVLGPCAGSSFSRINKNGGTTQFIVNLAFAKEKTFIAGRSYRLNIASTNGIVFKVGFNGPNYAGTMCGVPNEGYTGAWVTAQKP